MFDSILLGEYSLWMVIGLFYVLDNARQLFNNRLVLYEDWKLTWQISVPSDILFFLNRQFTFLNVLTPYTLAIPVEWLTAEPYSPARIRRADRLLRVARRKILAFRCISLICFVGFFIEGPILTYFRGLTYALLHVSIIYVVALAAFFLSLKIDHRFWRMGTTESILALFEAAICPAYLVNIAHRMSWKHIYIDVDGGAYGLLRCSSQSHNTKSVLMFALEELEQKAAGDSEEQQRLFIYRESILG